MSHLSGVAVEGRWTVFVCTGCGECTGRHQACDAKREATPVVPCDDAAVERGTEMLRALFGEFLGTDQELREAAILVLAAAGKTP